MNRLKIGNWKKHGFEFLSIFIAVVSAFALNNWNENRRANKSENKILIEIANGLKKDIEDVKTNRQGHRHGYSACNFFRDLLADQKVDTDSVLIHYVNLTRDYISIQNIAGYETLKSRGLELIENDSLRLQIISLYEYDYNTLRKFEEEYSEMQFQDSYFEQINRILAPNFNFDDRKNFSGIDLPLVISDEEEKILLMYLFNIQVNRNFILGYYDEIEEKINQVQKNIQLEIKR